MDGPLRQKNLPGTTRGNGLAGRQSIAGGSAGLHTASGKWPVVLQDRSSEFHCWFSKEYAERCFVRALGDAARLANGREVKLGCARPWITWTAGPADHKLI